MKTENGIFAIEDIGKSLEALPGGKGVVDQLKNEMGKPEYWEEFVKALKNYPYEQGKIDVAWDFKDQGSVKLDVIGLGPVLTLVAAFAEIFFSNWAQGI